MKRMQDDWPEDGPTPESGNTALPLFRFEPDKYRGYLEEFELSTEQENVLLGTLFNIMRTFVDIGFGLDSVQMFSPALVDFVRTQSKDEVTQNDTPQCFNEAAFSDGAQGGSNE